MIHGTTRHGGAAHATAAARRELDAVLRLVPDPQHGRAMFSVCSTCHGESAASLPKGWVPQIAGQHPDFIAKELVDYRRGLRWDVRMEIVGRHVLDSDQEIADVASYVSSLPSARGGVGRGGDLDLGKDLYRALCVTCHGARGEGSNARFVPRLAGQDYAYLLRQLHDVVDGRRPNMAAAHVRLLKRLDAAELDGLADYLSRLAAQAQDHEPESRARPLAGILHAGGAYGKSGTRP